MRKLIAWCLLLVVLIVCLGCGSNPKSSQENGLEVDTQTSIRNTTTIPTAISNKVTLADVKKQAQQVQTSQITDETVKRTDGKTTYNFKYFQKKGVAAVIEENSIITSVSGWALHSSFMDVYDTIEEARMMAVAIALLPVSACYEGKDVNELAQKLFAHCITETAPRSEYSFREGDWQYTLDLRVVANQISVTATAKYVGIIPKPTSTTMRTETKTTQSHHNMQVEKSTTKAPTVTQPVSTTTVKHTVTTQRRPQTTLTTVVNPPLTTMSTTHEGETDPCAKGHSFREIVEIIHHGEIGHYEDKEMAHKVTKYKCALCYQKFDTLEEYYTHFDSSCGSGYNAAIFRERYEIVEDWMYTYEKEWVVDQEAYDETVVIQKVCTVCGLTQ